jgi:hypothetical protein
LKEEIAALAQHIIEYGLCLNRTRARKIEPMIRALLEDLELLTYEREDAPATAAVRAALGKRGTVLNSRKPSIFDFINSTRKFQQFRSATL